MSNYYPHNAQTDIPSTQTQGELIRSNEQTKYVQHSIPRSIDPRGKGQYHAPTPFAGALMAIVNTAISAVNGALPGNGTVDIYHMPGLDSNVNAEPDPKQMNQPALLWNNYTNTNTINSGAHVVVAQCSQFFLVMSGDCHN